MEGLLPGLTHAPDIHPLFVHFPVAFWLAAAAFYGFGVARGHDGARQTGRSLLYLGTAMATAALFTGDLAADRMGHDSPGHDRVHVHRNLMVAAFVLAATASGLAFQAQRRDSGPLSVMAAVVLLVAAALTGLGADRGADLVFGYGMGVAESPPSVSAPDHHGDHDHGDHGH